MRLLQKSLLLNLLTIVFFSCQTAKVVPYKEAENELSTQLGNATLWFQKSAEMDATFLQAYGYGKMLLSLKMDTFKIEGKKPAVILDLDETVLDNSPYEARLFLEGETYASDSWNEWCEEANAKALPGAVDFLNYAKELGVEIFYISNRKAVVFESTLENLKGLNLPNADAQHLLLRTAGSDKTERRNLVKEEHIVLLYVGDNLTDYSEEYAGRSEDLGKDLVHNNKEELLYNFIMLPNPMYGEWESAIYNNDFGKSDEEKLRMRREVLDTRK
ncbi:5'-nucleotidase, lipoprotein e(P4) family [Marivirga sp. S37H4]|uniref:5'-nucleotidase, lipoprotein e(P4) family n=1 Tax=Marivirga aurantiaca TaxID=2802615 RepID=A0A934X1V6_9BACT|nr:5'-nucleotidase, lipoprotein e(P4) family [Marivirga aurantiaca]MBK6266850.1 5'-nucleotidase, lipoprotein e(P4) family [Marivirga aurantiaca]